MRRISFIKGFATIALGCTIALGAIQWPASAAPVKYPSQSRQTIARERAQRQALLKQRLDPVLWRLPERLEKQGKQGNLRTRDVTVSNGWVRIGVQLAKPSNSVVTRLRQLGFAPTGATEGVTTLWGKAPVAKLKEIATTNGVRRVSLPPKKR